MWTLSHLSTNIWHASCKWAPFVSCVRKMQHHKPTFGDGSYPTPWGTQHRYDMTWHDKTYYIIFSPKWCDFWWNTHKVKGPNCKKEKFNTGFFVMNSKTPNSLHMVCWIGVIVIEHKKWDIGLFSNLFVCAKDEIALLINMS